MKKVLIGFLKGLRVLISAALFVVMSFGIYYYLDKAFAIRGESATTNFKYFPEDSIDVLVLGSSHAQYSFDPSIFYANTGLYAYTAGSACQPVEVSYQILREVVKRHNPKVVVLEVFTTTPQRATCSDDSCYVIPLPALTGEEKYNIIDYLDEEKAKDYRFPLTNNHNDWKTKKNFDFLKPENALYDGRLTEATGYVYADGVEEYPVNWWHATVYDHDIDVEIEPHILESLNNIYDLCQEKGIQLLLYKTQIDGIDELNQSVRHKVWKWADERNIPYYDFIDHAKEDSFYINIHTNSFHSYISGAGLITNKLTDIIKSFNIEFNHKNFDELNDVYLSHASFDMVQMTRFEHDPKHYFKVIGDGFRGLILIKHNAHNSLNVGPVYQYLRNLGLDIAEYNRNFYAIIEDGEVKSVSDYEIREYYKDKDIVINSSGIYVYGEQKDRSDMNFSFFYESNYDLDNIGIIGITKNINVNTGFDYGYEDYNWDK